MESPTTLHRAGTVYSDLTGKFIVQSSQGNNYILIVYDGDSNYIFAEPLPSRTALQITKAYNKIHQLLVNRGLIPRLLIHDNETSTGLQQLLTSQGVEFQLVPPHQHRANAAERVIRTFKSHFISTLCSCDPSFPLHLWGRLLDQATITLNLLRTSSINNNLSAYVQVHGAFDFTSTPLGPPGTKVLVHERPQHRGTWSPHGTPGWYIGPAMDHYRSFTVFIPTTNSTSVSDTLAWFPTQVSMPRASSADIALAAAYDLTQALLYPSPASALSPISDNHRHALMELVEIFGNYTGLPPRQVINDPQGIMTPSLPRVDLTTTSIEPQSDPRVDPRKDTSPRVNPAPVPVPTPSPVRWSEPVSSIMGDPNKDPPGGGNETTFPTKATDRDQRVATTELSPCALSEPIIPSSTLTTNECIGITSNDLSYSNYNHNGPQSRRRLRHNRRHRNPISQAVSIPPPIVVTPSPNPANTHHSPTVILPTSTPAPDSPTIILPTPTIATTTTPMQSRRPTRGTKIARFDPKTHRLIQQHSNAAIQSDNTSADTYSNSTSEIQLRRALKGPDATIWSRAMAMELGRLAQGLPGLVDGTNTIRFIHHRDKPANRLASYCRTVCAINMNKQETHRVRLTYGGDRSDYEYEVSTPTVDTTTVKLHLNSIISTPGARHMTLDIKHFT